MTTNINLLVQKDEHSLSRDKNIKILNIIAIFSIISIFVVSIIIFVLIQLANPETVRRKQDEVLSEISKYQEKQAKLFVINNRVESIDGILKSRKDFPKLMKGLLGRIPGGIRTTEFEIKFEPSDNKVVMSGEADSLLTMAELINNMSELAKRKEFIKSLTLTNLKFNEANKYYEISIKSQL